MVAKKFWTLTLSQVSSQDEDLLTSQLFEAGASGVQEDLQFQQQDKKYLPQVQEMESKTLVAYFESPLPKELRSAVQQQYPDVHWKLTEEVDKDWLSEWKKGWEPFVLWENIWVVPSWLLEDFDPQDKIVLQIDPGMAFGTGTHATTQIASQLIAENGKAMRSALDVGTGSGILALLMHQLQVEKIYAYDNDDESKRVFFENLGKNSAAGIIWKEDWPHIKNLDLVVANIIDGVLLSLKEQFKKLSRPGLRYIFTGILEEREKDFLYEIQEGWSLRIIQRLQKDEWVGFCFEVKA